MPGRFGARWGETCKCWISQDWMRLSRVSPSSLPPRDLMVCQPKQSLNPSGSTVTSCSTSRSSLQRFHPNWRNSRLGLLFQVLWAGSGARCSFRFDTDIWARGQVQRCCWWEKSAPHLTLRCQITKWGMLVVPPCFAWHVRLSVFKSHEIVQKICSDYQILVIISFVSGFVRQFSSLDIFDMQSGGPIMASSAYPHRICRLRDAYLLFGLLWEGGRGG